MFFGALGILMIPLIVPAIVLGALAVASCPDAGSTAAARAARVLGIVAVVGGYAWGALSIYLMIGMMVVVMALAFSGEEPPYGVWNWWEAFI